MDIAAVLAKIGLVFHEFEAQETEHGITLQKPVHAEECHCPYEVGGNEEIDNKVILAGGWVYGKYDEPEKNMACGVLADLLCSSNESPLRKAILGKGLAENVELTKMDGIQQPYFVLVVRNTSEEKRFKVWETIESTLRELTEKGLDHNRLESILSRLEFNLREKESGMYPEGIVNAMRILDSSLYGGDPAQNLCYGGIFDSLRKKIGEGYFEGLLKETLLENPHCARLALYPSKTIGEEKRRKEKERFQEIKEMWFPIKREQAVEELAWLRTVQGTPDTEEQLAALPLLSLSDIPEKAGEIPQTVRETEGCRVLVHQLETDGIVHISYQTGGKWGVLLYPYVYKAGHSGRRTQEIYD